MRIFGYVIESQATYDAKIKAARLDGYRECISNYLQASTNQFYGSSLPQLTSNQSK